MYHFTAGVTDAQNEDQGLDVVVVRDERLRRSGAVLVSWPLYGVAERQEVAFYGYHFADTA
jgi:hypothetical protein